MGPWVGEVIRKGLKSKPPFHAILERPQSLMLQKICRQSFRYVTFGDEQTVHLTLSRELMTICLLNSHPHPYPYPWCYPYPRFSNASMIRQELVPKDLIQKGERHKTIVQKSPYHEGESITNF